MRRVRLIVPLVVLFFGMMFGAIAFGLYSDRSPLDDYERTALAIRAAKERERETGQAQPVPRVRQDWAGVVASLAALAMVVGGTGAIVVRAARAPRDLHDPAADVRRALFRSVPFAKVYRPVGALPRAGRAEAARELMATVRALSGDGSQEAAASAPEAATIHDHPGWGRFLSGIKSRREASRGKG